MIKILITDKLSDEGMEVFTREKDFQVEEHLKKTPEQLKALLPGFQAWVIRSGTTVTADLIQAAPDLRIIGRGGRRGRQRGPGSRD